LAKVCDRCSTMYTEYVSVCPKDGTKLTESAALDETTLVLERDSKQSKNANKTIIRSRCDKCSSDWNRWLEICPKDRIPTTISLGSRFQIWETVMRDPRIEVFKAKDVFTQKRVLMIILKQTAEALNAELSNFFTRAAQVQHAEVASVGLLEDGRPFAVCNL
jgi:hypothetical protein